MRALVSNVCKVGSTLPLARSNNWRFTLLLLFVLFFSLFRSTDLLAESLGPTSDNQENLNSYSNEDFLTEPLVGIQNLFSTATDVVVRGQDSAPVLTIENMTFKQRLVRSFEKTFLVDRRWSLFLQGLFNTIYITFVATVLGTLAAFLQCYMRRSSNPMLCYPAKIYIAIMQGTPTLVILLVLYYVVFTKVSITGELVAAIALGLNFASSAGEHMSPGVEGIDTGLIAAARALGFGRFAVFRKIVFPIACRRIMPVYKGEVISLLKTTSIVGYVAILDLTKASDIVRGRTYEAFFPLIATALIYLVTAHLLASGFAYLEYRLDPYTRRKRANKRALKRGKGEVNV